MDQRMVAHNLLPGLSWVGDLLLTWQVVEGPRRSRGGSSWSSPQRCGAALLHCGVPGPGWKGYPVRELEVPGWRALLIGELYGPQPDMTRVLAKPERVACDLNGRFLLLGHEEETGRWHAWTDRFGTIHAYHANHGGRSALGTFFPVVAAAASARDLDWVGLTGFFACGFFPVDRTFHPDVRILRPASHYVFAPDGRLERTQRTWTWWHRPEPSRAYGDTLAEYHERLVEVVSEHAAGGGVALPISGGLDSRSVASALGPATPQAFSYGYVPEGVEQRIASQVAAARGLPFESFVIEPYLFNKLERIVDCLEGFQDLTLARQAGVVDGLAPRANRVLAAHWGDVWLDTAGLAARPARPDAQQVLEHTLTKTLRREREWLLRTVCQPRLEVEPETLLAEIVDDELARLPIEDPDLRVKAFKTDQWSFRWTLGSLRMYQPGAFARLPFYDTRLTDFFLTVPSEFHRGRRLQIDQLRRFAPDLARIPWEVTGVGLDFPRWANRFLVARRAVARAVRLLRREQVVQRNWEVQLAGPERRRELEHWLTRAGLRLHDLVPLRSVRRQLDGFTSDPLEHGYTVTMLLSLSAWLELHG